jgi:CRP/FNR family cyclic AMP-dependent transcriptional regulator
VLKKGAVVGELTFVDDQPRSATVQALEDSELLVLSRADMDELAREYPQAAMALLRGINRILSLRLRKAVDKLAGIF